MSIDVQLIKDLNIGLSEGVLALASPTQNRWIEPEAIVAVQDALDLIDFNAHAVRSHKPNVVGTHLDNPYVIFKGFIRSNMCNPESVYDAGDTDYIELAACLVDILKTSARKNARGSRSVYVDVHNDVIIVGTTVIYSKNWATADVVITPEELIDAIEEWDCLSI